MVRCGMRKKRVKDDSKEIEKMNKQMTLGDQGLAKVMYKGTEELGTE